MPPDTPGPQVDASRYLGAMNTLFGKEKGLGCVLFWGTFGKPYKRFIRFIRLIVYGS